MAAAAAAGAGQEQTLETPLVFLFFLYNALYHAITDVFYLVYTLRTPTTSATVLRV
jgi:hypothetical protein